jgi:hypothetical protein
VNWASASIFGELAADSIAHTAPELMVYDGELGDLPVFVVTPTVDAAQFPGADARTINFMQRMRLRYLTTSARSQLIDAPAGTGHNFPYESPEFVVDVVRRILTEARARRSEF